MSDQPAWGTLREIGAEPGDTIISRRGSHDGWVVTKGMIETWQYPDYAIQTKAAQPHTGATT